LEGREGLREDTRIPKRTRYAPRETKDCKEGREDEDEMKSVTRIDL
jgi:hypothetical protein